MTSHEYLQLSNKLEDCIPLLAKCGASSDKELLRNMFLKYYKKYSTVKTNEQKGERS